MNPAMVETVTLEKLQVVIFQALSKELIFNSPEVTFSSTVDYLHNTIVCKFRDFVWSQRAGIYEYRYPATWWQAFKEQHFPAWLLRKWPTGFTVKKVDVRVLYPDLRYAATEDKVSWAFQDITYQDEDED